MSDHSEHFDRAAESCRSDKFQKPHNGRTAANERKGGTFMESIVLTLGQCADLLQCSPLTIRRIWMSGKFPAPVNVGRIIRWRESDVRKWLAEQPASTRYSEKVEQ